jgi:hypothetical protein
VRTRNRSEFIVGGDCRQRASSEQCPYAKHTCSDDARIPDFIPSVAPQGAGRPVRARTAQGGNARPGHPLRLVADDDAETHHTAVGPAAPLTRGQWASEPAPRSSSGSSQTSRSPRCAELAAASGKMSATQSQQVRGKGSESARLVVGKGRTRSTHPALEGTQPSLTTGQYWRTGSGRRLRGRFLPQF